MNDPSSQLAAQPVEQLPIPLFDGVVLAARAHDGAIYLALRDLCATLGLALRAQQERFLVRNISNTRSHRIQLEGAEA